MADVNRSVGNTGRDDLGLVEFDAWVDANGTGGNTYVAQCYDDGVVDDTAITFGNTTVDGVRIEAASGHEHGGTVGGGVVCESTGSYMLITGPVEIAGGVTWRWTRSSSTRYCVDINSTAYDITVHGCIFDGEGESTSGGTSFCVESNRDDHDIHSCLFVDCTGDGTNNIGVRNANSSDRMTVSNCIFYNCDEGIDSTYNSSQLVAIRNSVFMNCTADFVRIYSSDHANTENNFTDLASGVSGFETSGSATFSVSDPYGNSGSDDYLVTSWTDLEDAGTDLSASGIVAITEDFIGNTRSDWDAGAEERQSAPSGNPHYYYKMLATRRSS